MERPALARLLDDIRTKKIDVVVVYKVDRLTRALSDFAKIVEIFDTHGVSFVSITQSFNTTTSMGRLTLNVLLSFAQFEREVIAERVRDKIAASKAKGMWMGGVPPIGYDLKDKQLVVNSQEAGLVRSIFRRYLDLPSVHELMLDLRRRGITGKRWTVRNGRPGCSEEWSGGALLKLLKRRLYLGVVHYKGKDYLGRHEAIIDQELFDKVQSRIAERGLSHGARRRPNSSGKLIGLIFDDAGNRMSPVRQRQRSKVIRYYVSQAAIKREHEKAGTVARVRADRVEELVDQQLAELRRAGPLELEKVIVSREAIGLEVVRLDETGERRMERTQHACRPKVFGGLKRRVGADGNPLLPEPAEANMALLLRIARARRWADEIESGVRTSAREIAEAENILASTVMRDLAQTCVIASHCVGFTLPGMIEEPGSFSGSASSPRPARGPDPRKRISLAILKQLAATVVMAPCDITIASCAASASNLFGAVLKGSSVISAIFAATSLSKPFGALRPVPTAVPPCASSISDGSVCLMRAMPFSICLA
jgi:DNA invertase Pin-like site-specific DNA recombinase